MLNVHPSSSASYEQLTELQSYKKGSKHIFQDLFKCTFSSNFNEVKSIADNILDKIFKYSEGNGKKIEKYK